MSGFTGWLKEVASNANTTLNSEKAASVKKKLIVWGAIVLGLGIILMITSIVLFMSPMFSFGSDSIGDFNAVPIIIGFVLFIPAGFTIGGGSLALKAGIGIVIGGIGAKVLDVNKDKKCPKCGDKVEDDEMFCNNCGNNLRANKLCECGTQNDFKDVYCKKCGKKL